MHHPAFECSIGERGGGLYRLDPSLAVGTVLFQLLDQLPIQPPHTTGPAQLCHGGISFAI